jgi:hypothetical protein
MVLTHSRLDTGGCVDQAPICSAGFNYDKSFNLCANSASGWNSTTPASECSYAQHKCTEHAIYYFSENTSGNQELSAGVAVMPLTKYDKNLYATAAMTWCPVYKYIFAFKKWAECTAKNVTVNSDNTAARPNGWDCKVEKRCVCVSCTLNHCQGCVKTGEPCSCDSVPASVEGRAAMVCAQT